MSKRGEKLRPEVLAILRRRSGSLSAYDVLGELCEANPKVAQPTICRVLAALTERGRVHRIESLNAFIADRHQHASILSICHDYGTVEESVSPAPTAGRAHNTASRATGPSLDASSPCPPAHGSYCAAGAPEVPACCTDHRPPRAPAKHGLRSSNSRLFDLVACLWGHVL